MAYGHLKHPRYMESSSSANFARAGIKIATSRSGNNAKRHRQWIVSIEIGRVIIAPDVADRKDTSFAGGTIEQAPATPPYEGMFDVLPNDVRYFQGEAWLVPKAGRSAQEKTRL